MPTSAAQSFLLSLQPQPNQRSSAPLRAFERALVDRMRLLKAPATALFFVSGSASAPAQVSGIVASAAPALRALVVPSPGVLTESGEVEGAPAVAGLVWAGAKGALEVGAAALGSHKGARLVFTTRALGGDARALGGAFSFGAGSTGEAIYAIEGGAVTHADVVSMVVSGSGAPVVEEALACRTVAGPFRVTGVDGRAIVSLDDTPALERLSKTMGGGKHGGLVVIALASPSTRGPLFRPIKGVDPARKAFVLDDALSEGDELSFAVRDATFAKAELAEAARRAEQSSLGSAPRFALFMSSVGRGRGLFRDADGDVKLLKRRFPKLAIAGMHAAYALIPAGEQRDAVAVQHMSGLLALFRSPS